MFIVFPGRVGTVPRCPFSLAQFNLLPTSAVSYLPTKPALVPCFRAQIVFSFPEDQVLSVRYWACLPLPPLPLHTPQSSHPAAELSTSCWPLCQAPALPVLTLAWGVLLIYPDPIKMSHLLQTRYFSEWVTLFSALPQYALSNFIALCIYFE